MHRAQEAESTSEAWADAYGELLRKARKLKETLRIARERMARFERDSEENERYIRLQKDIVSEKVKENNELNEFKRHARHLLREGGRIETERDRALEALDTLTNDHSYETDHLIFTSRCTAFPLSTGCAWVICWKLHVWKPVLRRAMHRQSLPCRQQRVRETGRLDHISMDCQLINN